jgi:hypothetical protein
VHPEWPAAARCAGIIVSHRPRSGPFRVEAVSLDRLIDDIHFDFAVVGERLQRRNGDMAASPEEGPQLAR